MMNFHFETFFWIIMPSFSNLLGEFPLKISSHVSMKNAPLISEWRPQDRRRPLSLFIGLLISVSPIRKAPEKLPNGIKEAANLQISDTCKKATHLRKFTKWAKSFLPSSSFLRQSTPQMRPSFSIHALGKW